jgi:multicomponent Na+:H+ antiporter subunit B
MRNVSALVFACGLAFLLLVISGQFLVGGAPMLVGEAILQQAANEAGAANLVTSVVLGYRGIDTLGEIAILFTAAAATSLVLSTFSEKQADTQKTSSREDDSILAISASVFFPLLITLGLYIILHGHITPGGGFQGGVILAMAFFLPLLAVPSRGVNHSGLALVEGFAGASFIIIGLIALFQGKAFLQPFFGHGEMGSLFSAGTLPLLYTAVGLKVGAELSGLLANLAGLSDSSSKSRAAIAEEEEISLQAERSES